MQRLKNNKKYLLLILCIIVLGIFIGIIYYFKIDNNSYNTFVSTIKSLNNWHYNSIIKDLIIMSLLLISSFFIIGIPFSLLYILYEIISFTFITILCIVNFHFKGLLFIIVLCLFKLIPFSLIIIFLKKVFNISRLSIGLIIYKNEQSIRNKIIKNFTNALYIILFVLIINILLYFLSSFIFSLLK